MCRVYTLGVIAYSSVVITCPAAGEPLAVACIAADDNARTTDATPGRQTLAEERLTRWPAG